MARDRKTARISSRGYYPPRTLLEPEEPQEQASQE
jgi:hypothetical protein